MTEDYDDFGYRRLSVRIYRASKEYTCYVCRTAIKAGEKYVYAVYILDGQFKTDREHYPSNSCPWSHTLEG